MEGILGIICLILLALLNVMTVGCNGYSLMCYRNRWIHIGFIV